MGRSTSCGLVISPSPAVSSSRGGGGRRTSNRIAGTDSCQTHHLGHLVSGRLGVRMDDGTEMEFGPGDVYEIPPGHDGWVIGDEPAVGFEIMGAETFAKSR